MAIDLSISNLKNKITSSGGLQRSNRFLVTIRNNSYFDLPNDNVDSTPRKYIAENVLFPNISMTTQADGLAGPGLGRTVVRGLSYKEGVIITFPVFGDLIFLEKINSWMKSLYRQNTTTPLVWISEYHTRYATGSELVINLLDLNGNERGTYTFNEVYPVEISPIQLTSNTNNEYLKVIVRFAFRDYTFSLGSSD
jgi:hypothetical protein